MVRLWHETLLQIGNARFDVALQHVLSRSPYRPSIAEIRRAAGLDCAIVDPVETECKAILRGIFGAMRGPHGPKLKEVRGKVLFGTEVDPKDANGDRVAPYEVPRDTSTPFAMSDRTRAALVTLGWGNLAAGVEVLAEHPAVNRKNDDGYEGNRIRQAEEIQKRFVEAYREVA